MVSHSAEAREAPDAAVASIPTILTGAVCSASHFNAAPGQGATPAAPLGRARISRFAPPVDSSYRSSTIASCSAGLIRAIALLSGVGCTRLVSRVTYSDRSGSIHSDVPVKPT